MNRHSKYYRLNPVKGKLGKVNHKVVGDIKYDTFRRFNSYNVATKHAILGAVGKLLDEMVREDAGLYIRDSGPRKRPILIFVDGEWKVVWLPDPIAPYATPSDFSYKKIIGVSFNVINDTILIITVMPGGPAEKAGLQPFDRIISINDSTYAGQKYSQAEIMRNLRGPRDSKVKLGIQRDRSSELAFFEVTRGEVPNHSIEVSYKIGRKIGYIKIRSFARTTYNEFITAIAKLKEEGCTDFIIDLRDNAGGILNTAVHMLNEFIPRGRPIVYMEGKAYRRQDFHADGSGSCQEVPIIVLTDELSGSASEIFAGAIQDNDRGLIIGRRSFGKGLVQAPIPLSDGSELRLTIARYYTPSGRCIQKMYQLGKSDEYE